MAASIWYPGTSIPSGGTIARAVEPQTIAAGQTLVNFLTFEYVPGSGDLFIFVDGFYFVDFAQTSSTSITLNASFSRAVELVAVAGIPINDGIGGDAVAFSAAGAGSVARTMQSKVREASMISIVDKGAEIGTDASTALQRAIDSGNQIFIPPGPWAATTAPTITDPTIIRSRLGATVTGAGFEALGLQVGISGIEQSVHLNTGSSDVASFYFRRQANHTGGTPGFVNACIRADTFVTNASATAFEWAIVGVMYNYANAGENVGGYFQGLKYSTGATWGATIEVKEMLATADPTTGTVGLEVDIRANGTDANTARVLLDAVLGKHDTGGTAVTAAYGFRLQDAQGAGVNKIVRGFTTFNMTCDVGFDTSQGTINQAAFKMAAGQAISFNADVSRKMYHDGSGLRFADAANTIIGRITDGGAYQGAGGIQIVGARDTGWAAMTGTANKATVYDTATVTTAQLAGRMMALQAALTAHGLIGA